MSTTIHWTGTNSLPEHQLIIAAVPGIGNVGKLVVDTLNEQHESSLIARIIHPDMPPHPPEKVSWPPILWIQHP